MDVFGYASVLRDVDCWTAAEWGSSLGGKLYTQSNPHLQCVCAVWLFVKTKLLVLGSSDTGQGGGPPKYAASLRD